jgi:hypothetical protein
MSARRASGHDLALQTQRATPHGLVKHLKDGSRKCQNIQWLKTTPVLNHSHNLVSSWLINTLKSDLSFASKIESSDDTKV